MTAKPVLAVPARIASNPASGWTVYEFKSAREAAEFITGYPECAMPCWKRFEVISGDLMQVR